ncbi:MAG: prephenate dehydrogenase/arogenate dehydrogenase family protein [Candidatus Woesearchaeota archaeon]
MRVGIIGGNGGMGKLIREFISEDFTVTVSDVDTELSNRELAEKSDIIVISVPIERTVPVIEEIAPILREEQVIMDITSMKCEPMEAMRKSKAVVIGLHPMFGPSVSTISGQTVVLTPDIDHEWVEKVISYLKGKGMRCKITTPEKHDEMMGLIQVLVHFNTIAMGHTMASLGFDIEETLGFTSPIYRMELGMIGRIFAQEGSLYGNIQMRNPKGEEILRRHMETIRKLFKIIEDKDMESFIQKFRETAGFFKDFKHTALKESEDYINGRDNHTRS